MNNPWLTTSLHQALIDPIIMPEMKYFCKSGYSIMMGTIVMTDIAILMLCALALTCPRFLADSND
jgi:hypothetical protein